MDDTPSTTPDNTNSTRPARRRRAVIVGSALAAAVAIALPVGLIMADNQDRDAPGPGASPTPTATATPSDTPGPTSTPPSPPPGPGSGEPQPWVVTGLATGQPPAVPYLVGSRLHVPGQPTLTVDLADGYGLARMSDGRWLALTMDPQTGATTVELRDASWRLLGSFPSRDYENYALSPSGGTAVWGRPDGMVVALQAGADTAIPVGKLPADTSQVRTVRGSSCATDCVISGTTTGTNGSYVDAWGMTSGGKVVTIGHGLLVPADATDDARLVGLTEITDDGSCSALVDLGADRTQWSTCANTLDAFSPDGTLLLASEAYHDGWGSGEIAVYDAQTGARTLDLLGHLGTYVGYQEAVWEDDAHLLVKTYSDGDWAVVRIAVDGSMEYALAPVTGNDMEPPFWVLAR
jgi:hypothetical protein